MIPSWFGCFGRPDKRASCQVSIAKNPVFWASPQHRGHLCTHDPGLTSKNRRLITEFGPKSVDRSEERREMPTILGLSAIAKYTGPDLSPLCS
jgi:hypothetical protein